VASRYPDAGIKLAGLGPTGDGGNKARLTEETTKETVKTIAQGMPECIGLPVVTYSCGFFISTRGYGCDRAPGIPCALCFPRDVVSQDPGAMRAAGLRRCVQREAVGPSTRAANA
jgi:hypothetical protein